MSDSASGSRYLDFLYVEGERLGWIFRDRNLYRTLQDLPDYALIEVTQSTGELSVRSVECNPDIVSLPRVTTGPLPDLPLPDQAEAAAVWFGEAGGTPPGAVAGPGGRPARGGPGSW